MLRRMPPPERRLSMLFSATLSHRVLELAYEHMNDPELVDASRNQVAVEKISQKLYHVSKEEKLSLLLGLLARTPLGRAMVFSNTRRGAERVEQVLRRAGYRAGMLSGDVPQTRRLALLSDFQSGRLDILVATDVAARGLHIPDVTHVFNFDLPQDPEDYVHRIGRTARVGAEGEAITLACDQDVYSLQDIEELLGHPIPAEIPGEELFAPLPPRRPRGGARGDTGSENGERREGESGHRGRRSGSRASPGRPRRGRPRGEGGSGKSPATPAVE